MKKWQGILLSFFIVLLVLCALDGLYTKGLLHNKNVKTSFVNSDSTNYDLLIHGPCEPLWMIDPHVIDSITGLHSYNLSLSHSDFADNYLHLHIYLKHHPAPRYLFLYVTPESMDEQFNTFNSYRFAPFIGDPVVDSTLKENDPAYFRWTILPFMRYAYYNKQLNFPVLQGWKHWITHKDLPYFPTGYEPPVQVKWDNHLEKFNALYPSGYHFSWSSKRESSLRKLIQLAKYHQIKIYLYESPVLKEAILNLPNRKEAVDRIRLLAHEFGIEYVQFEGLKMAESREFFMSPLNTNLKGSAIVNDTLGRFIQQHVIHP